MSHQILISITKMYIRMFQNGRTQTSWYRRYIDQNEIYSDLFIASLWSSIKIYIYIGIHISPKEISKMLVGSKS